MRPPRPGGCRLRSRSWPFALLLALACRAEPVEPVTRDEFIDVMVALRRVALEADSADYEARKDSILRAAGVTDSALVGFARRNGRDVAAMAAIWDSIARRLVDADTVVR